MKKKIVISAINLFEGGGLSILKDCLSFLDEKLSQEYDIIAFVHKSSLFDFKNIKLIELPKSRTSYFLRLYYEYIWFYFKSNEILPYLWFSLHDVTPNVKANIRAVYCHNPSPFYRISLNEFILEPTFGFFNTFYKLLYSLFINKNKYIVVQQDWLRDKFKNEIKAKSEIIVARPNINIEKSGVKTINQANDKPLFFFPTLPRVFKNIECLCEAARILDLKNISVDIIITISGSENTYVKKLFKRYGHLKSIHFIGRLSRNEVFEYYEKCDALVFPSKLETWGLPISEAKMYNKPILVADLPYAHETIGNYQKVSFFNATDSQKLSELMCNVINGEFVFDGNIATPINNPSTKSWDELFHKLLL